MPWLKDEQLLEAQSYINDTYYWIKEKMDLQVTKPLNEDPVFYISELKPFVEHTKKLYISLKNVKKPKPDKKVPIYYLNFTAQKSITRW